jgi:hypothetical protein
MGSGSVVTGKATKVVRSAAVLGSTALLAWFVGAQGVAAIAALGTNPALLSQFDPATYPAAGIRLAQLRMDRGRPNEAVALARPAALADPLNVRAVRILGLALDANNKIAAVRVMRAAEKLSWRDTPTSMWALRDAALSQNVPGVLNQIDALARRQVQSDITSKVFYGGLADAPSRHAFAGLLASNPPWRSGFFANIRVNLQPSSYEQMEMLLEELDRTNAPSSPEERLTFIDRMADSGQAGHARAYWIRSFHISPAAPAQTPYDPQFRAIAARQSSAATSPFEWAINQDANQFVGLRQTDKGPALDVAPGAEDGTALISQTLVLAPGPHLINTLVEGPAGQAPAGWQLACSQSDAPLIRTFAHPGEELSGITIDVPTSGCSTQRLILTANGRIGARPISIRAVTIS